MEIIWDKPAEPFLRSDDSLLKFAHALVFDRPGQWALFGACENQSTASTIAYDISHARGTKRFFGPPGSFEAESRTMLGQYRVYVRYMAE